MCISTANKQKEDTLYQYTGSLSERRQKLNLPGFSPLHTSNELRSDKIVT